MKMHVDDETPISDDYMKDIESASRSELVTILDALVDQWSVLNTNLGIITNDINRVRNLLADKGMKVTLDEFDDPDESGIPVKTRTVGAISPGIPGVQHRERRPESNFREGDEVDKQFENIDDESFNIHQKISGVQSDSRSAVDIVKESLGIDSAEAQRQSMELGDYFESQFNAALEAGWGPSNNIEPTEDGINIKVETRGI